MKKKLIGLALSAAMLFSVLSVPAFAAAPEESADPALTTEQTAAEEENCFFTSSSTEEEKEPNSITYVALGDSITTGVGLKDTHFSSTAKSYDVQENYHGYSKDCYVARVADALGLDRDHAVNYGMPAAMSSNILDLVRTGSTASGVAYYDLPTLRQELTDADLITLLIGSNDTVLQLVGAMGRASGAS